MTIARWMSRLRTPPLPLAMLIGAALAHSAAAAPVIDQDSLYPTSQFAAAALSYAQRAQTFTLGQSGLLSQLDLQLYQQPGSMTPPTVQIRTTTGGVPNPGASAVLFETTVDIGSLPFWEGFDDYIEPTCFDLRSAGIMVNPGDVLAISYQSSATSNSDWTMWSGNYGDKYAAGASFWRQSFTQAWTQTNDEFSFRTWVDPNPSALPPGPQYRLFETARALPPDDNSYQGSVVDSTFYQGVNFEVVRPTRISSIGGQLVGGAPGQVFAAIVQLNDRNGAPNPTDFSGSDVLGTTLIDLPGFGSSPTDSSAPLDLTLQPGFYGLWFGSGKFGATGDTILSSENDPVGSWATWSLRQPEGERNFFSNQLRMFVDAASEPGTFQFRPVVDVAAEDLGSGVYTLADGEASIEVDASPFGSVEKRGVLEFDLRSIPANAIVESATLEVDTNGRSGTSQYDPQMILYGYSGDGEAEPAEATRIGTQIGVSPELLQLGMLTTSIDPAYVQSLIGVGHLGIVARETNDFSSIDFHPSENRGHGEAPLLTIHITLPGDYNGDVAVDDLDYQAWRANFGSTTELAADGNGDGTVDAADYVLWRKTSTSAATSALGISIPEPPTAVLLVFAVLPLAARQQFV